MHELRRIARRLYARSFGRHYVVVVWDDEAKVWFVAESSVHGLCTEAETQQLLLEKLAVMIPELLAANKQNGADDSQRPKKLSTTFEGPLAAAC